MLRCDDGETSTHKNGDTQRAQEEQRKRMLRRMLRNQAVIDLLNAWEREDAEEQRETLDFLMKALDEDRPSQRKLFS